MKQFLSEYGLYQVFILLEKYEIGNQNYINPIDFKGHTFEYKCEKENAIKTFEVELDSQTERFYGLQAGDKIPNDLFIDEKLNFTFKAIGKCKSCKEYQVVFLLNVYSNNPISNIIDNISNIDLQGENNHQFPNTNIYIQKVGALPEIKITPDKIISKYFDRETCKWYFKAINSLNENYGIGSFAYFRRIIEKELLNIIEDLKTLPDSHETEIQSLLDKHKETPAVSTIYENIFEYLPHSLKTLGDNPIRLLYNQTSEGLHSLTEDQCLEKAKNVLKLLNFVIKKINEEKSEIRDLRETIKGLK